MKILNSLKSIGFYMTMIFLLAIGITLGVTLIFCALYANLIPFYAFKMIVLNPSFIAEVLWICLFGGVATEVIEMLINLAKKTKAK